MVRRSSSVMPGSAAARREEDGRAGLVGGADRDPAQLAFADVVADLEAEGAPESQGCVRVVMRKDGRVNGEVHGVTLGAARRRWLLDS